MDSKSFVTIIFIIISGLTDGADRSICTTIKSYMTTHLETSWKMEPYNYNDCGSIWCDHQLRYSPVIHTEEKVKEAYKLVHFCCPGYLEIRSDPLTCEPICNPPCQHGLCKFPGMCDCYPRHKPTFSPNVCQPTCIDQCLNSTCTAVDVCTCLDGYERYNNSVCVPFCNETCINGKCIAPDTCSCDEGYALTDGNRNICVPKCDLECLNGICSSPNNCTCSEGYYLNNSDEYNWNVCIPYCENCNYGVCEEPNKCVCFTGYDFNELEHCTPRCNQTCQNGFCSAPNECMCNIGYSPETNSSDVCVPYCPQGCDNGKCIAPEICECNKGYINEYNTCVPSCEQMCNNGNCSSTNFCTCHPDTVKLGQYECAKVCITPNDTDCYETDETVFYKAIQIRNNYFEFSSNNYEINLNISCSDVFVDNQTYFISKGFNDYKTNLTCYTEATDIEVHSVCSIQALENQSYDNEEESYSLEKDIDFRLTLVYPKYLNTSGTCRLCFLPELQRFSGSLQIDGQTTKLFQTTPITLFTCHYGSPAALGKLKGNVLAITTSILLICAVTIVCSTIITIWRKRSRGESLVLSSGITNDLFL